MDARTPRAHPLPCPRRRIPLRLRHIGYVGQNLTLDLTTNRTLRLASLGPERVAQVIEANLTALLEILRWNARQGIRLFRVGSSVIPFASHERFELDWEERFAGQLGQVREFVRANGMRLSMHPGQYTVINSPNPQVVANAKAELLYSARFLQQVDPLTGTITLHIGGAYGEPRQALARFIDTARTLPELVLERLCVENDDTTFDVIDALEVARPLGIPVVFDFHHHRCLSREGDVPSPELLHEVVASWAGRVPKFHLSSPRTPGAKAHADYIEPADLEAALGLLEGVGGEGHPFDLMLEAKAKDRAALRVLEALR